ncbi:MAG: hypothetical protein GY796_08185 [Chloroflexi bacterium]|nr:hypothetical protein [Chloroflexota bacterium]
MKKYLVTSLMLILIMVSNFAQAKTFNDFIQEGAKKHDVEKGFIDVPRAFLRQAVPVGFRRSKKCDANGENCQQKLWKVYCAGGIFKKVDTGMVMITLDRCGYRKGRKNRRYPPSEQSINRFLAHFDTYFLLKKPGRLRRRDYEPEE